VTQAGQLKVEALVSEDLTLKGVVSVGACFTPLLKPAVERET